MSKWYSTIEGAKQAGLEFNFKDFIRCASWPCVVTLLAASIYYGTGLHEYKFESQDASCVKKEVLAEPKNNKRNTARDVVVLGGAFLCGCMMACMYYQGYWHKRFVEVDARRNKHTKEWEYAPRRIKSR